MNTMTMTSTHDINAVSENHTPATTAGIAAIASARMVNPKRLARDAFTVASVGCDRPNTAKEVHFVTANTLISTEELAGRLGDPNLIVLDARFTLDDETWGTRSYLEGHIPSAQRADLASDLAGETIPGVTGRRPFPTPEAFAATCSRWGIDGEKDVVVYDADGGLMAASRTWFMLNWLGHDRVWVLDGGLGAWIHEGRPLEPGDVRGSESTFVPRERPEMLAFIDEVAVIRNDPAFALYDSRGAEGYHGRGVYHDPVKGHIKGAGLADRAETMAADGRFQARAALREHFAALVGDRPTRNIVFYCGSGVTAAQNVVAMVHAGFEMPRMYVGSWSEWIIDHADEVEL